MMDSIAVFVLIVSAITSQAKSFQYDYNYSNVDMLDLEAGGSGTDDLHQPQYIYCFDSLITLPSKGLIMGNDWLLPTPLKVTLQSPQ